MPSIGLNRDVFLAELEKLGEDQVRMNLAQGIYGSEKTSIVTEWLRRREQARSESFQSEQTRIAERAAQASERSAHEAARSSSAAEQQAATAEKAYRVAVAALITAIVAAILSVIAMVR